MGRNTKIEWTQDTWNPVTGCKIDTPGCINCYAMRLAASRLRHHPSRKGLTKVVNGKAVWTGEVRLNEGWLRQPLEWRKPRRIFVCAHGDLFYEEVPDEWIDQVFAVMALSGHHTFQVLTKRADRMRAYMARLEKSIKPLEAVARSIGHTFTFEGRPLLPWPIRNVWLGVSAERQREANDRIPQLLQTPAAVRFISAEPLIGPLDLTNLGDATFSLNALSGDARHLLAGGAKTRGKLDWVIVGGESGPGARDMSPDWARALRDQCAGGDAAFFMKQMSSGAEIPADLMIRQFPAASR